MATSPGIPQLDVHVVPLNISPLAPTQLGSPAKLTSSSKDPLLSHSSGLTIIPCPNTLAPSSSSFNLTPGISTVSTLTSSLPTTTSLISPSVSQIARLPTQPLNTLSLAGNLGTQLISPQELSLVSPAGTNFISPSIMTSIGSSLISPVVPSNIVGQVGTSPQSLPNQGNLLNSIIQSGGPVIYSGSTRPVAPPAYNAAWSNIKPTVSKDLTNFQKPTPLAGYQMVSASSSGPTSVASNMTGIHDSTNEAECRVNTHTSQSTNSAQLLVTELKSSPALLIPESSQPFVNLEKHTPSGPNIGIATQPVVTVTSSVQTLPHNLLGIQGLQQPKTGTSSVISTSKVVQSSEPCLSSSTLNNTGGLLNLANIGGLTNSNIVNLHNMLASNPDAAKNNIANNGGADNVVITAPHPVILTGMPIDSIIRLPQSMPQNLKNNITPVSSSSTGSVIEVAPAQSTSSTTSTTLAPAAFAVNGLQGQVISLGQIASICPASAANQVTAANVIDVILRSQDLPGALLQLPETLPSVKEVAIDGGPAPVLLSSHNPTNEGHYCVFCNLMYVTGCPSHGQDGSHMSDSPILSRARLSFPKVLTLQTIEGDNATAVLGVFAVERIPVRTRFGPLVGVVRSKEEVERGAVPFFWKLYDGGKCSHLMECTDEQQCNWMMFMRSAKLNDMQNVVAYQQSQDIYYVSSRDIIPGEELQFWFSHDYAQLLGVPEKPQDCFRCSVCNKPFPTLHKRQSHMQYVHPDMSVRRWKCQVCTRAFTSSTKLNTHMLGHMGMKPHECPQCGKKFSDQSNLRMHLSVHTGERRFKCVHCTKAFRQKAHLNSHLLTHTCEKKLSCSYCPKMFARVSDLRQHQYIHTKEKQYNCTWAGCTKSFYKLQSYKKHLKVHSGQKEHLCLQCGKFFSTRYHVQRHQKACKTNTKGAGGDGIGESSDLTVKLGDDVELATDICLDDADLNSVET